MQALSLAFSPRFIVFTLAVLLTLVFLVLIAAGAAPGANGFFWVGAFLLGALSLLGVHDLAQKRHAVLRNYPISAHLRFLLEGIRPEMRQYFFESETDGLPFSRTQRAIVYQRAKMALDKRPFGTLRDTNSVGYEWMRHSITPKPVANGDFRITVGGPDCAKPYSMSVFNISAMSFGALSANAIRALNKGAALGGFAHDTGEGGFSPYHREGGGDIVWEIGSLFRLPHAQRPFRPRKVPRGCGQRPDQDDRDQALARREARSRRRIARGQGECGDRGDPRR